jgi:hypothetical protein
MLGLGAIVNTRKRDVIPAIPTDIAITGEIQIPTGIVLGLIPDIPTGITLELLI